MARNGFRAPLLAIAAAGALVAAGAATLGIANKRWNRATSDSVAHLLESSRSAGAGKVNAPPPDVPAPVARYLRFAFADRPPAVRTARIRWRGEFRSRPEGDWAPFTAVQHFTTNPPGFVWSARIRMMPALPVQVRDAYVDRSGSMRGRIAALVPVVDEGGTPEMAQSALARWLGEAAWFPSALAPGGPVRWEAIDDSTARAIVQDDEVRAEAEFEFAPGGEIVRMRAMRYRDVDGTPILTPFEGRYGDYEWREGVRVPVEAEVAWDLPEGPYPYWRGRPTEIVYQQ